MLVVLSEPPPKVVKKLQAKGVDTRGVFLFEIEGRYYLPKVDTQQRVEAIFNQIEVFPNESKFQRNLVSRVLKIAEVTLNEMAGLPLDPVVSTNSNSHPIVVQDA